MEQKNREVEFWSADNEHEQSLLHTNARDAAEEWVLLRKDDKYNPLPEVVKKRGTVFVYGFARMVLNEDAERWAENFLDQLIDSLDSEYGTDESTKIKKTWTKEIAKAVSFVLKDYKVLGFEEVTKTEIPIKDFLNEEDLNRSDD